MYHLVAGVPSYRLAFRRPDKTQPTGFEKLNAGHGKVNPVEGLQIKEGQALKHIVFKFQHLIVCSINPTTTEYKNTRLQ